MSLLKGQSPAILGTTEIWRADGVTYVQVPGSKGPDIMDWRPLDQVRRELERVGLTVVERRA